ncbi:hypothetical protein COL940_006075 [Colletotrichum noveboracense]|nr:hypothetical protein COL940_006075 [Colletotrichum noveboracense]
MSFTETEAEPFTDTRNGLISISRYNMKPCLTLNARHEQQSAVPKARAKLITTSKLRYVDVFSAILDGVVNSGKTQLSVVQSQFAQFSN